MDVETTRGTVGSTNVDRAGVLEKREPPELIRATPRAHRCCDVDEYGFFSAREKLVVIDSPANGAALSPEISPRRTGGESHKLFRYRWLHEEREKRANVCTRRITRINAL